MTLSITLGSWMVPALITVAVYLGVYLTARPQTSSYDWYGFGTLVDSIFLLVGMLVATVVSLITWLVWALLW